ncbi:haloacid dehalogenase-like hydrolase family protein [Stylonychia lemnae]|uniref:Haloacid dehalogenase-like hydrolase family protein n=1 Tax=Stylonychia lemnae TaxID=5949 RepID=A0A078AVL6_STYLE|nr:haloacid dehalogenase-like hydrolase family protein [Stylonychia lemnae]|eukprot:CDW84863.1 haloacid dehalogenase-like hydrolase family protein [Stylonychia lemnae]
MIQKFYPHKKIFLITNNSTRTRQQILEEKLRSFNFELDIKYIYSSAYVSSQYVKQNLIKDTNQQEQSVYIIGQNGLKQEMKNNGIRVINDYDDTRDSIEIGSDEISSMEVDSSVCAVIAGINFSFTYRKLCLASLYLQLNNSTFIATNSDKYFTTQVKDRHMPAGGSIVNAIIGGTLVNPILIGKPERMTFEIMIRDHNLEEESLSKFLMIGDNLLTDVLFGNNCGIDTLVVLSGNTSESKAIDMFINKNMSKEEGIPTYVSPYFGFSSQNLS